DTLCKWTLSSERQLLKNENAQVSPNGTILKWTDYGSEHGTVMFVDVTLQNSAGTTRLVRKLKRGYPSQYLILGNEAYRLTFVDMSSTGDEWIKIRAELFSS